MSFIKLLIVLCLLAVFSLGAAMYHMVSDQGKSKKMVTSLTLRVARSVASLVLLFSAW